MQMEAVNKWLYYKVMKFQQQNKPYFNLDVEWKSMYERCSSPFVMWESKV